MVIGFSQGLLFGLFKGSFKVSSGAGYWYISSYGTDFDDSEIAIPVSAALSASIVSSSPQVGPALWKPLG